MIISTILIMELHPDPRVSKKLSPFFLDINPKRKATKTITKRISIKPF
jgi:hypothetical protein